MAPPKILAMHTRCRKCLIAYHKFNGIMTMKKHVEYGHVVLLNILLIDVALEVPKSPLYCEPSKKRVNVVPFKIIGFFLNNYKFKKDDLTQSGFVEDFMSFIVKGLLPMRIVESIWLQQMAYMLCPWVVFPSMKAFVEEIMLNLVNKTMSTYVVHA
jgi:hypothetical protein